jgi:hypothetical protein
MCNDNMVPAPQRQLLTETATATAAASTTSTGNTTLTSQRGDVKRVAITTPTLAAADLAAVKVTLYINGVGVVQNASLDQFSGLYDMIRSFVVSYPQASVVSWSIVNTSATPVQVNFLFDYVLY